MNWLTDTSWQIAYGVPPKNGYNSIRKILNGNLEPVRIPPKYLKKFDRFVFVVRHPVARFLSLWRSKCRDHESGPGVERLTQDELFTRIETGPPDDHWQRQVELIKPFPDAELVRLENMEDWWRDNMNENYPHEHRTIHRAEDDISPELHRKVIAYYEKDLELYIAAA